MGDKPFHTFDLTDLATRIKALEDERANACSELERIDEELAVVRGPLPLKHKQPVDSGALGEVVSALSGVRNLIKRAALALALTVLGGAGGTLVAIRGHYVDQGRALERKEAEVQYLKEVERRLRVLERRYLARDTTPVVAPGHEASPFSAGDRSVLPGLGQWDRVPDDEPSDR